MEKVVCILFFSLLFSYSLAQPTAVCNTDAASDFYAYSCPQPS